MSLPIELDVFLHYHIYPEPHPRLDTPSVVEALSRFCAAGVMSWNEASQSHEITEKGRLWVKMLCATPFPEQQWVDPRTKEALTPSGA